MFAHSLAASGNFENTCKNFSKVVKRVNEKKETKQINRFGDKII